MCCIVTLIPLFCGCGDSYLKRKYNYTPPEVPPDIPRFVAANPRIRGLEPSETGQIRIDLHDRYLTAHERGFCDAAREWKRSSSSSTSHSNSLTNGMLSHLGKRGYWDGYSLFKKRFRKQTVTKSDRAERFFGHR